MFWYKIFNIAEFDALDIVSKSYTYDLEGIGRKTILVTKGALYGFIYDDIYLAVDLNGRNSFSFGGFSILRSESGNVYLGVPE